MKFSSLEWQGFRLVSPVLAPALVWNVAMMDMETATQPSQPSVQLCPAGGPWSMCSSAVQIILRTPIVFLCHSCEVPPTTSLPASAATCLGQPQLAVYLSQPHSWALGLSAMGPGTPSH